MQVVFSLTTAKAACSVAMRMRPHRAAAVVAPRRVSVQAAFRPRRRVGSSSSRHEAMLRLRVKAEGEAGEAPAAPATDPETEQDLIDVSDINFVLGKLSDTRDMTFSEVKLVIGIEDPRAKERREELGVEDESGVSREDLQYCLQEVKDGDMPEDRVALRRLAEEMREWPYLDLTDEMKAQAAEAGSSYASITNTGVQVKIEDENESDSPVPAWMGYGLLYGISVIPIIIGVTAVIILFVNSLR